MKIGIAGDHHGICSKKELIDVLEQKGYIVIDYGTNHEGSVDYPLYAFQIGESVQNEEIDYGILLCGSGIGMSIACNKVKGVRCAKVNNMEEAMYCRLHNNANVIALSSSIPMKDMIKIVDIFLETDFSVEERHHRRVQQISDYEENR